ncbi:RHS repeat domain-containing protein [Agrilutibacter solisilvae]|uniref:RHS repeat-associated core domain-containing protein n=1 Tax=Agrilutibacter solisilvae TaxID=2763317 RepID=A0A975AQW5_9GAMM|nr:RHS repeat-associated core domain-containing protein [Lysobacter solisilvae]QSX77107.1 RHS repeat-associated core domain-containing protein [Lysobacter solisilvae]
MAATLKFKGLSVMSRVFSFLLLCLVAPWANAGILGYVDSVTPSGTGFEVKGWACSTGVSQSIAIHFYVGGSAGTGTGVGSGTANLTSEAGISSACQTSGIPHRFSITLPASVRAQYANQAIYVHGISPNGGTNDLLGKSGVFTVPAPVSGIVGVVESAPVSGSGFQVTGWACSGGVSQSVSVHVYVGGPSGVGTGVGNGVANLTVDPAISTACQTSGIPHRFAITLPASVRHAHAGKPIYVHGISPNGGSNLLLTDSGALSVPGPLYVARKYTYNSNNELCKVVEPETGATLLGYDGAGNVAWSASGLPESTACGSTAANARKATRTYDARSRLVSLAFPDGRGNVSHTYVATGLPKSLVAHNDGVNSNVVTTEYIHNRRGLLELETLKFGANASIVNWPIDYGYNALGHLQAQRYNNGQLVDFAPNALGQATQVGAYATGASYYPNGALKQFTYGNGIVHTLTQNVRGLPARSFDAYGTTEILDDRYDFDGNGNVAAITDGLTGSNQRGNRTMTYDRLDRLVRTESLMFGTAMNSAATFTYDALDNLTRVFRNSRSDQAGRDWNYFYDGTNRLTSIEQYSTGATVTGLDYDEQGNLEQKSVSESNNLLFDFDYGNRLRKVSRATATTPEAISAYLYDGLGRRIWDNNSAATGKAGSKYSLYSKDGQLLIASDLRAGKAFEYMYLAGSLVAIREAVGSGGTYVYETKYQHTDALGSPVAVTKADRALDEQRTEYEPYGKVLQPLPVEDGPGYTGHVLDAATGMNYMQQRYYDPAIGLFLSVDPVTAYGGDVRHFNRYAYAYNNPYRFTDPDGRAGMTWEQGGKLLGRRLGTAGLLSAGDGPLPVGEVLGACLLIYTAGEIGYKIYQSSEEASNDGAGQPTPGEVTTGAIAGLREGKTPVPGTPGERGELQGNEQDADGDFENLANTPGATRKDDNNIRMPDGSNVNRHKSTRPYLDGPPQGTVTIKHYQLGSRIPSTTVRYPPK